VRWEMKSVNPSSAVTKCSENIAVVSDTMRYGT
jgi:hypothetical protein